MGCVLCQMPFLLHPWRCFVACENILNIVSVNLPIVVVPLTLVISHWKRKRQNFEMFTAL